MHRDEAHMPTPMRAVIGQFHRSRARHWYPLCEVSGAEPACSRVVRSCSVFAVPFLAPDPRRRDARSGASIFVPKRLIYCSSSSWRCPPKVPCDCRRDWLGSPRLPSSRTPSALAGTLSVAIAGGQGRTHSVRALLGPLPRGSVFEHLHGTRAASCSRVHGAGPRYIARLPSLRCSVLHSVLTMGSGATKPIPKTGSGHGGLAGLDDDEEDNGMSTRISYRDSVRQSARDKLLAEDDDEEDDPADAGGGAGAFGNKFNFVNETGTEDESVYMMKDLSLEAVTAALKGGKTQEEIEAAALAAGKTQEEIDTVKKQMEELMSQVTLISTRSPLTRENPVNPRKLGLSYS